MAEHILTKKLFWYCYELEKYETTSLEQQVIKKAKQAGFITNAESADNLSKLAWIKKMTKHAEDAFKLEEVAEGEQLEVTIDNFKQLVERREKHVSDVLEMLAKYVLDASPAYKG
ncbi:hypothetical protein [Vibrio renipiscarius]|uniref:Uncharacterized protein n=1 Tax=Vibrio renipiscarius TaxID=1461322 RepID=A0A0C2NBK3_9VIBR|nr:hypothetical protein [Vibrio renipiscarius]KII76893.1 hypothetical protein PL18_17260 [Vibrio renipiscarius]KII77021.1 hypothetical protein OJ16_12960 [Vibrio renipiscarius]